MVKIEAPGIDDIQLGDKVTLSSAANGERAHVVTQEWVNGKQVLVLDGIQLDKWLRMGWTFASLTR